MELHRRYAEPISSIKWSASKALVCCRFVRIVAGDGGRHASPARSCGGEVASHETAGDHADIRPSSSHACRDSPSLRAAPLPPTRASQCVAEHPARSKRMRSRDGRVHVMRPPTRESIASDADHDPRRAGQRDVQSMSRLQSSIPNAFPWHSVFGTISIRRPKLMAAGCQRNRSACPENEIRVPVTQPRRNGRRPGFRDESPDFDSRSRRIAGCNRCRHDTHAHRESPHRVHEDEPSQTRCRRQATRHRPASIQDGYRCGMCNTPIVSVSSSTRTMIVFRARQRRSHLPRDECETDRRIDCDIDASRMTHPVSRTRKIPASARPAGIPCATPDDRIQNGMSSSEKSSIGGGLLAAGAWRWPPPLPPP